MGRARSGRPVRPVRIRVKRLDQIDEAKLALALWLTVSEKPGGKVPVEIEARDKDESGSSGDGKEAA